MTFRSNAIGLKKLFKTALSTRSRIGGISILYFSRCNKNFLSYEEDTNTVKLKYFLKKNQFKEKE
jgi:hypothetical protein